MRNLIQIAAGDRFGRLTAVRPMPKAAGARQLWLMWCDCGAEKSVDQRQLAGGKTKSCGCLHREGSRARAASLIEENTRHGMYATPEYRAWGDMLNRCRNPKHRCYAYYGGRGITVCARWLKSDAFLADMGPRPSPKHSLERIDNSKGYSPENCRWATRAVQANNTRKVRQITAFGRTQSIAAWAREGGIPAPAITWRLDNGWPPDEAVALPSAPASVRGTRHHPGRASTS